MSANPKVLRAISKAAKSRGQIVQATQVGTELSDLPTLQDGIDEALYTLVFLDHLPVPAPELIQAAEQIYSTAAAARIYILAEKDPGAWPDELFAAGLRALLTPPFSLHLFQGLIDRVNERSGR